MITVTRLDGVRVLLNHELIETIQQTPDTTVSLINGDTLLVRDTPEDLVQRIIDFKQKLVSWSRS
jgi:flagellar protein FlbD